MRRAITAALPRTGILKRAMSQSFRHLSAPHWLEAGNDTPTVSELLGHEGVATTMIDTQVLNKGGKGVKSPHQA